MHSFRHRPGNMALFAVLCAAAVTAAAPVALSADEATGHDHTHAAGSATTKPDPGAKTDMMQNMQAMHAKMMAAKTPAERAALMQEQMAMMQTSMSMMKGMHGATAMRMDMMQMMMQMMMDRMGAPAMDAPKSDTSK